MGRMHHGAGGSLVQRGLYMGVAIARIPCKGNKQIAGGKGARVNGNAGDGPILSGVGRFVGR